MTNNNYVAVVCTALGLFVLSGTFTHVLQSQTIERYPDGSEGIKAASLPPPGFYWASYNAWYEASTLNDLNGKGVPIGFSVNVLATIQRFAWATNLMVLGGKYGLSITIPYINTHLKASQVGLDDNESGFGDLVVSQFIRWVVHTDIGFGIPVYFPTGSWDATRPALPGKNYYTFMPTGGLTYSWARENVWAASILARYEFQTKVRSHDFTPGNDFHFEWGVSNTIAPFWDLGIVGYCQWQVSDDKGKLAARPSVHDRVFAVGPELAFSILRAGLVLKLRYEKEFGAVDRPLGEIGVLTLAKIL